MRTEQTALKFRFFTITLIHLFCDPPQIFSLETSPTLSGGFFISLSSPWPSPGKYFCLHQRQAKGTGALRWEGTQQQQLLGSETADTGARWAETLPALRVFSVLSHDTATSAICQ